VPQQLGELSEQPAQARLARVVAPFDSLKLLADPATNPAIQLQRARNGAQLGWLGDHYRYTRRDLPGLVADQLVQSFYNEAALAYLQDAVEPPAETYLQFGPPADVLDFRSEKQAASTTLPLRQFGPPGAATAPKEIRPVGVSAEWLQVAIPDAKLAGAGPWEVPLDIQFRSSGGGSDPNPAEGFLVQADLGDRHYHTRVSLQPPVPDSQRLQILVNDSPKEPEISLAELRLRPNQKQSVHLFVRNPSDTPRKVQIELKAEGTPPTLSGPVEVGAKETKKVVLGKPMPAPEGKKPELPELSGTLQLRLLEADKKVVLDDKRLRVSIAQQREYVRVSNIRYEPGDKNKLIVQVRAASQIEGPPCRVRLELPRERMPGFLKAESGTFEGQLQGDAEVTLSAENLLFEDAADENGYVYLTVDGYERAFIFRITFARRGTGVAPQEVLRPELRIRAPRYLAPGQPCPVKIETDNSQAGANLEIGIDRNRQGNFALEPLLQGDRRQRVHFAPVGPEGTLFFETAVSDWSLVMNLAGIVGTRDLRGRLLDRRGGEITRAIQPVTVDPNPPIGLRIIQVGKVKEPNPGQPIKVFPDAFLPVIVEGIDPESGVDKVRFYLAKPMDGKMPPGAPMKEGEPLNADKTRWRGLVPADKEGATDLTVEFVNRVGLTTLTQTYALHVSKGDAVDPADKPKPGSIAGTVLEGDRPQPGLTVELIEPKAPAPGDKPKSTMTDQNGKFEFKDLEPGTYRVKSAKPVSNRKGEETVIVTPGKAAPVAIKLLQ
jgi:hypothetical protein